MTSNISTQQAPTSVGVNTQPILIDIIAGFLENTISTVAKEAFLSDPVIKIGRNLPGPIQRSIINKYFYNKLLSWRSTNNVAVFETIAMLCDDGDDENWMRLFGMKVLPFLRSNSVLGAPLVK